MLWQKLTYGKKYAAIEHAENNVFQLLQLRKQKKEFVVSKRRQEKDFQELIVSLKKQSHVFVIFNNEQILTKKITEIDLEEKALLRLAFPTIKISDFYYETYKTNGNTFVAIARKKYIDAILLQYQKKGIWVIDFSLGNLVVKNLQEIVAEKKLQTSNASIYFEAKTIHEIKKETISKKTFIINELPVSNSEILPLAGIIAYYTKNTSSLIYQELKENYTQKRIFEMGLKSALGFLLVLLLVNFLIFSSYRNQVNGLSGVAEMFEESKIKLEHLQKKVNQKKQLVASFQTASKSKRSQYLNELGNTTPTTILLSQMNFQPVKGAQRTGKKLVFDEKKILLKGACKKDEDFSAWIALLEKQDWVKSISINGYGKGKKRGSLSNFEFEITIDE